MDQFNRLSIITTCMNRLEHLKVTLPIFLKQSNSEVIVVDYGCSQGTKEYVNENYPMVKVIKAENILTFSASKARNIGAKNAKGEVLFFCDADAILHEDIGLWIKENFSKNNFYITPKGGNGTMGTFIVSSESLFKAGGYDEAFDAWGGEDKDIYDRLEVLGLNKSVYPLGFVTTIAHSDEMRQLGPLHGALATKEEQVKLNKTYRDIKSEIMKAEGVSLDLDCRVNIMTQVKYFFKNQTSIRGEIEISYNSKNDLNQKKTFKFIVK